MAAVVDLLGVHIGHHALDGVVSTNKSSSRASKSVQVSTSTFVLTSRCCAGSSKAEIQAVAAFRKLPLMLARRASLRVRVYFRWYASATWSIDGFEAWSNPPNILIKTLSSAPQPFMAFSRRMARNSSGGTNKADNAKKNFLPHLASSAFLSDLLYVSS